MLKRIAPLLLVVAMGLCASSASAAPSAIESGAGGSCYLDGGAAYCWTGSSIRDNYWGVGPIIKRVPTLVAGLTGGVTDVSISKFDGCAAVNGSAKCWKSWTGVPSTAGGLTSGVTAVAAADDYSCAVVAGAVKCWGYSTGHYLGSLGPVGSLASYHADAQGIPGLTDGVTGIDAGPKMACAIGSGAAKCWGTGHLGDGSKHGASTIVDASGLSSGVTKVAVDGDGACAIQSGALKCWGQIAGGHPGDGSAGPALSPIVPTGLSNGVTDVAMGPNVICAVVAGVVKCWGNGSVGELGDGARTTSPTPVAVPGIVGGAQAVATTANLACAIVDEAVQCWGSNEEGLLGDGIGTPFYASPQPVPTLNSGVTDISVGENLACAVASGAGKCWGRVLWPSSGYDFQSYGGSSPTTIPGLESGVEEIEAAYTVCAVVAGALRCGEVNAPGSPPLTTAEVGGESDASNVHSVRGDSCAVVAGAGKCWNNFNGAAGPVQLPPAMASGITAIQLNWATYCAIVNGGVKCWNPCTNYRVLQCENPFVPNKTPEDVVGLTSGVSEIAVSTWNVCAIVNGAAKCFGDNSEGQLGDGTLQSSGSPVQVLGLESGVTSIATSGWKTCAVKDGDAYCWGPGGANQLEAAEWASTPVPQKVLGLPDNVTRVAPGTVSSCAIAGGAAYCWGSNIAGQLGIGAPYKLRGPEPVSPSGDDPTGGFVSPWENQQLFVNTVPVKIETANAAHTTCALDDGDFEECPNEYSNLAEGPHDIHLRIENAAGETFNATAHLNVDAIAPTATIVSPASGSVVDTSTPALDIDLDSYGFDYVSCTLDGVALPKNYDEHASPCLNLAKLPTLYPGEHTLIVSVHRGGDVQTAISVFTYDGPADPPTDPPTPPTTVKPPKVTGKATESTRAAVTVRARPIGKRTRNHSSVKLDYALRFAIPRGLDPAVACSADVEMRAFVGKRVRTARIGQPQVVDGICRVVGAFNLPGDSLGRNVKFRFAFLGNSVVAPAKTSSTIKLR